MKPTLFLEPQREGGFVAIAFDGNHGRIPLEKLIGERADVWLGTLTGAEPLIHGAPPRLVNFLLTLAKPEPVRDPRAFDPLKQPPTN